jgi:hypothetical protein
MADGEVSLSIVVSNHISAAFHQNSVPTVREITVENGTDRDLADLEIEVASEPEFAAPLKVRIDRIPPKSTQHVRSPNLPLSIAYLRKLTEAIQGELRFTLKERGAELAADVKSIHLLPPSHWGGTGSAPELLAAFVRPNDPAIDAILREAGLKLAAVGKPNAIDGYTSGRRDRAWELAAAIWSVLAAKRLTYVLPRRASRGRDRRFVRHPKSLRSGSALASTLPCSTRLRSSRLASIR